MADSEVARLRLLLQDKEQELESQRAVISTLRAQVKYFRRKHQQHRGSAQFDSLLLKPSELGLDDLTQMWISTELRGPDQWDDDQQDSALTAAPTAREEVETEGSRRESERDSALGTERSSRSTRTFAGARPSRAVSLSNMLKQLGSSQAGLEVDARSKDREKALEDIRGDRFNIWDHSEADLQRYVVFVFEDLNLMTLFNISPVVLVKFVTTVRARYKENPYHNFRHACDVALTAYNFVIRSSASTLLTPLDLLALITAALCHDLEHPGQNNKFQVDTHTELARVYNDISVLENHHAACAFEILGAADCNILANLSAADFKEVRRTMIHCILHTDMSKHFEQITTMTNRVQAIETEPDQGHELSVDSREDRDFLLCVLLHSADIANVTKPFATSRAWSGRIQEEMFSQGDLERNRGLSVSPFMDRNDANEARTSLNFIDFLAAPLFTALTCLLSGLEYCTANIVANRTEWQKIIEQQLAGVIEDIEGDPIADEAAPPASDEPAAKPGEPTADDDKPKTPQTPQTPHSPSSARDPASRVASPKPVSRLPSGDIKSPLSRTKAQAKTELDQWRRRSLAFTASMNKVSRGRSDSVVHPSLAVRAMEAAASEESPPPGSKPRSSIVSVASHVSHASDSTTASRRGRLDRRMSFIDSFLNQFARPGSILEAAIEEQSEVDSDAEAGPDAGPDASPGQTAGAPRSPKALGSPKTVKTASSSPLATSAVKNRLEKSQKNSSKKRNSVAVKMGAPVFGDIGGLGGPGASGEESPTLKHPALPARMSSAMRPRTISDVSSTGSLTPGSTAKNMRRSPRSPSRGDNSPGGQPAQLQPLPMGTMDKLKNMIGFGKKEKSYAEDLPTPAKSANASLPPLSQGKR